MEKSQIEKIIEEKVKQIRQDAFNLDELIEILKSNPNIDWKWFEKLYNNFIKPIIGKCKLIQDLIKEAKVKERKTTNNSVDEKLDLILNGVHSLDARVAKVEVDMAVVRTDMVGVKDSINRLENGFSNLKDHFGIDFLKKKK